MKKRILSFALALTLLLPALCSCGEEVRQTATAPETATQTAAQTETDDRFKLKVLHPMEKMPDYSLPEGASIDQMRQMAVQAMRDELTIPWMPAEGFTYQKEGTGAGKEFKFPANRVYGGLPYTNGASGLIQFLQSYNFKTGILSGIDFKNINTTYGNTCAESVMWGWAAVCPSVRGQYVTWGMTAAQGVYPVGDYTYDFSIQTFKECSTVKICQNNGKDKMMECYAAVLPADGLVSAGDGSKVHARMAIEKANVVRDAAGKIDPEKSTIKMQDQSMGFNEYKIDSQTLNLSGHIDLEVSFEELYNTAYIPVTTAEFLGQRPYEVAKVEFTGGEISTVDDFLAASVKSNYIICAVNLSITDQNGTEHGSQRILRGKDVLSGEAFDFSLSDFKTPFVRSKGKGKVQVKLSVALANGLEFVPFEGEFTL